MNELETGLEWLARALPALASWAAAGTLALALGGAALALLAQWVGAVLPRGAAAAPRFSGERQAARTLWPQRGHEAARSSAPTCRSQRGSQCAGGQVCAA